MRILVVHQYFLRGDAPGGSRFNEFARLWTEAGHEVTVIAGQVDYASGERYPGVSGWVVRERSPEEAEVFRVYTPSTYQRGRMGRMWAFFGWTVAATLAMLRHGSNADVVIATSPPLTVAVPAIVARTLMRVPTVFEVRDLWPESAVTTGVLRSGSLLVRLLYALERWAYRVADRVVVLTPAFVDDLTERTVCPEEKIRLVPNGADLESFSPGPPDERLRRQLGWQDRFVVLYAGAHGVANHLDQLLDAAELLKDDPRVVLATVGDGPERSRLEEERERRGLENVDFLGPVPKQEMPRLLRSVDVGAAILKRVDTFKTVYPNKIFDYMAVRLPVLCVIDGVARELVVDRAEAGVFAEPERPRSIARAVQRFRDNPEECRRMGERGERFVRRHFSRETLAREYLAILAEIARR